MSDDLHIGNPSVRVFKYSWYLRAIGLLVASFFAVLILTFFLTTNSQELANEWWVPVGFLAFSTLGMYLYVALSRTITLRGDLLEAHCLLGQNRTMSKSEIASVNERPMMQTVVVRDHGGATLFTFGSQLTGYNELFEVLQSWVPPVPQPPLGTRFERAKLVFIFMWSLVGFCFAVAGWLLLTEQHTELPAPLFSSWAIAMLVVALFQTKAITVLSDQVIVHRWTGDRRVRYSDIGKIEGSYDESEIASKTYVFHIHPVKGRKIRLSHFPDGGKAVYEALHKAWQAAREGSLKENKE